MPTESLHLVLPDLATTDALAGRIASLLRPGDAVLLEGPLGAGKTAVARALLRTLAGDADFEVPSPSYTLVQEYDMARFRVSHFDLWRLDGPTDMAELGWDAAREGVVLVEWPERLGDLRPIEALSIRLSHGTGEVRHAALTGWPDRLATLSGAA